MAWAELPPFTCTACHDDKLFPAAALIATEVRYDGLPRADVAA